MDNDKELLELAARVIGLATRNELFDGKLGVCYEIDTATGDCDYWNPLVNDGDALRLAVKLNMHIHIDYDRYERMCSSAYVDGADATDRGYDPLSATRRAIVKAAAEIGRQIID